MCNFIVTYFCVDCHHCYLRVCWTYGLVGAGAKAMAGAGWCRGWSASKVRRKVHLHQSARESALEGARANKSARESARANKSAPESARANKSARESAPKSARANKSARGSAPESARTNKNARDSAPESAHATKNARREGAGKRT